MMNLGYLPAPPLCINGINIGGSSTLGRHRCVSIPHSRDSTLSFEDLLTAEEQPETEVIVDAEEEESQSSHGWRPTLAGCNAVDHQTSVVMSPKGNPIELSGRVTLGNLTIERSTSGSADEKCLQDAFVPPRIDSRFNSGIKINFMEDDAVEDTNWYSNVVLHNWSFSRRPVSSKQRYCSGLPHFGVSTPPRLPRVDEVDEDDYNWDIESLISSVSSSKLDIIDEPTGVLSGQLDTVAKHQGRIKQCNFVSACSGSNMGSVESLVVQDDKSKDCVDKHEPCLKEIVCDSRHRDDRTETVSEKTSFSKEGSDVSSASSERSIHHSDLSQRIDNTLRHSDGSVRTSDNEKSSTKTSAKLSTANLKTSRTSGSIQPGRGFQKREKTKPCSDYLISQRKVKSISQSVKDSSNVSSKCSTSKPNEKSICDKSGIASNSKPTQRCIQEQKKMIVNRKELPKQAISQSAKLVLSRANKSDEKSLVKPKSSNAKFKSSDSLADGKQSSASTVSLSQLDSKRRNNSVISLRSNPSNETLSTSSVRTTAASTASVKSGKSVVTKAGSNSILPKIKSQSKETTTTMKNKRSAPLKEPLHVKSQLCSGIKKKDSEIICVGISKNSKKSGNAEDRSGTSSSRETVTRSSNISVLNKKKRVTSKKLVESFSESQSRSSTSDDCSKYERESVDSRMSSTDSSETFVDCPEQAPAHCVVSTQEDHQLYDSLLVKNAISTVQSSSMEVPSLNSSTRSCNDSSTQAFPLRNGISDPLNRSSVTDSNVRLNGSTSMLGVTSSLKYTSPMSFPSSNDTLTTRSVTVQAPIVSTISSRPDDFDCLKSSSTIADSIGPPVSDVTTGSEVSRQPCLDLSDITSLDQALSEIQRLQVELASTQCRLTEQRVLEQCWQERMQRLTDRLADSHSRADAADALLAQWRTRVSSADRQMVALSHTVQQLRAQLMEASQSRTQLQQELERSLAAQKMLLQQVQDTEYESRELHDFMQLEKNALVDALREAEAEKKGVLSVANVKDDLIKDKETRCSLLLRLAESRAVEIINLKNETRQLHQRLEETSAASVSIPRQHQASIERAIKQLSDKLEGRMSRLTDGIASDPAVWDSHGVQNGNGRDSPEGEEGCDKIAPDSDDTEWCHRILGHIATMDKMASSLSTPSSTTTTTAL